MPPKAAKAPAADAAAAPPPPEPLPKTGDGGAAASGALTARTPRKVVEKPGVSWTQLLKFLFPANMEHPDSTGRLELFARYGPVDAEGKLRGGIGGKHVHTDAEIRQMIAHEIREALFALLKRDRTTVESIVEGILPVAVSEAYTVSEVKQLLAGVPTDSQGLMVFVDMQKAILANQRRRLRAMLQDGAESHREKAPKVAFQSESSAILLAGLQKKNVSETEEQRLRAKRLNLLATAVASLEDQNRSDQLNGNVFLCRGPGSVSDRWDRYCALRRSGKSSHVQARNTPRYQPSFGDGGTADRHAGCASLTAAMLVR